MKNLTLLLLLSFVAVFGQDKITFTHQVDYVLVEKSSYSEKVDSIFINAYYNDKNDVLMTNIDFGKYFLSTGLIYDGNIYETQARFNQIKLTKPNYYSNIKSMNNFITNIQRIDKTDKINGKKCTYYAAKIKGDSVEFCMAKNNKINSFAAFNNELSDKGLLLKINIAKENFDFIYLDKKDINLTVDFNVKKEVANYRKTIEILKKEQEEYLESTEEVAVEEATDDETVAPPPVEIAKAEQMPSVGVKNYVEEYETYDKQKTLTENDLAINHLTKDDMYWKAVPTYCQKLDTVLPNLNNETYQQELKNYAGQVCDLYLSKSYNMVDFKGTLDEVRRSVLYMQTHFNTLKKSDQKKVIKFLDTLD